jgi:hypothetical protein
MHDIHGVLYKQSGETVMPLGDVKILKKIHPKADIYFLRIAMLGGIILILQMISQVITAIGLLK